MKKTLSLIAIAGSLLSTSSYAKTEGNYVGIDVLRSTAKVKSTSTLASDNSGSAEPYYNHSKKDSAYGVGLNYRYAFNFNNFFVAPGISYEFLNNEIKSGFASTSDNYFSQKTNLKSSLSLRANLGYDINDQFAVYVPVGISQFYYDIKTADSDGSSVVNAKKSNSKSAAFIGFGFSYEPVKNWVMNLEYNKYQNLKITSGTATIAGGQISAKTNVDVVKLGLAYRF
ncbi:MAG: porin family protein [Pelagibacterales bacterium]|nr:porin family protein [Pelagibacterales bacterium]